MTQYFLDYVRLIFSLDKCDNLQSLSSFEWVMQESNMAGKNV